MPNPVGTNGGQFIPETPYGDVKRQTELTRQAPISGAPVSGSALNTARRSGQQAKRGGRGGQAAPPPDQGPPPIPVNTPAAPYGLQVAQVWADIANTPGAEQFPVLAQLAAEANQAAQSTAFEGH